MGYSVKRVDGNQKTVVKALRDAGTSIGHTHTLGRGFPDFVIGVPGLSLVGDFNLDEFYKAVANIKGLKVIPGVNILVELKDGSKSASSQKLTPDEVKWHEEWLGNIVIVNSELDAVRLISATDEEFTRKCMAAKLEIPEEKVSSGT